jgi:hypothetical protein
MIVIVCIIDVIIIIIVVLMSQLSLSAPSYERGGANFKCVRRFYYKEIRVSSFMLTYGK